MAAVAEGRKDEWLALFTPNAVVEDPVGPSLLDPEGKGHHGHDGIAKFWDQNFGAVSRFRARLADEALPEFVVPGQAGREDLERYQPAQPLVAGAEHHGHPAWPIRSSRR